MLDLYNIKYDRETLKANIYAVKLIDILKTQKIDAKFAVHYILNKKYQIHPEDNIDISAVLKYQRHLSPGMLQKYLYDYDADLDSVEDFEEVSKK